MASPRAWLRRVPVVTADQLHLAAAVCLARVRSNRESHVAVCLSALLVSHSVWRTQLDFLKNSTCLAESVFSPLSFHMSSFHKKLVFFTIKLETWVALTTKLHEWVVSTIIF